MKKLLFILPFIALLFNEVYAQCPSYMDDSYWNHTNGTSDSDHQQSFSCGTSGILTNLNIKGNGGFSGTYTLSIYQGVGVGGALLYSANHDVSGTGTAPTYEFILNCGQEPNLTAGFQYTFRIQGSMPILYDFNSIYPGGSYTNSGGSVNGGNADMNYEIWISSATTPTATISVVSPISCAGGSDGSLTATVGSATPPYTFQWMPSGTTQTISGLSAGTYYVQMYDANNCFTCPDTFILADPPAITVEATPDVTICEGASHTINATVSNASTYLWTPSTGLSSSTALNITASPTVTTEYFLTATSGVCSASDSITITVDPAPIVSAGADQSLCDGDQVTLTGTGNAVSYTWDSGFGDGVPFTSLPGVYTYTVTGTSGTGCTATDNVVVTWYNLPTIYAGADDTICDGNSYTLNGTGGVSYVWTGGVTDGTPFTPTLGSNSYTVTGTDANGCVNTDDINIEVLPVVTVDGGADQAVCDGQMVTLTASGSASAYTWNLGVIDGVAFTPPLGTNYYVVTGAGAGFCPANDTVIVLVDSIPNTSAGVDQSVCEGVAVTLNGAGANTYTWDTGITDGVPFVPPVGTNVYTVTGTSLAGCTSTDQMIVTVSPAPPLTASPDQTFCNGDAVTLTASGCSAYNWDAGGSFTNSYTITPAADVVVEVIGFSSVGCKDTLYINLTLDDGSSVDAGSDATQCQGFSVTLNATGGVDYVWNGPGITNQNSADITFPVDTTAYYFVDITTSGGCQFTDSVLVSVSNDPNCTIEAINTFTPNNDGLNEFWKIIGIESFPDNQVVIYNRWGDIVFDELGYDNDLVRWQGTLLNGSEAPSGTYFYTITFTDGPTETGWLQLMK
ncbi:gliding motility-associated C-terminal domain-containing protein [Paracrocinitomix mangrovi]|uniref:T9SS type B sorting domain-containing protein n=1 Tax=Paracrocinitomix mangrovi TaxID=2862509 RepID=UPI001C8DC196|nr:gliding motility-associated C-terminal domain-containing protein [Paracrocinitomix mangrovi]UKN03210.1 gliding motility-associated C-terminal domain-containing protein [Paracrocinitomix mangrovi]